MVVCICCFYCKTPIMLKIEKPLNGRRRLCFDIRLQHFCFTSLFFNGRHHRHLKQNQTYCSHSLSRIVPIRTTYEHQTILVLIQGSSSCSSFTLNDSETYTPGTRPSPLEATCRKTNTTIRLIRSCAQNNITNNASFVKQNVVWRQNIFLKYDVRALRSSVRLFFTCAVRVGGFRYCLRVGNSFGGVMLYPFLGN